MSDFSFNFKSSLQRQLFEATLYIRIINYSFFQFFTFLLTLQSIFLESQFFCFQSFSRRQFYQLFMFTRRNTGYTNYAVIFIKKFTIFFLNDWDTYEQIFSYRMVQVCVLLTRQRDCSPNICYQVEFLQMSQYIERARVLKGLHLKISYMVRRGSLFVYCIVYKGIS